MSSRRCRGSSAPSWRGPSSGMRRSFGSGSHGSRRAWISHQSRSARGKSPSASATMARAIKESRERCIVHARIANAPASDRRPRPSAASTRRRELAGRPLDGQHLAQVRPTSAGSMDPRRVRPRMSGSARASRSSLVTGRRERTFMLGDGRMGSRFREDRLHGNDGDFESSASVDGDRQLCPAHDTCSPPAPLHPTEPGPYSHSVPLPAPRQSLGAPGSPRIPVFLPSSGSDQIPFRDSPPCTNTGIGRTVIGT